LGNAIGDIAYWSWPCWKDETGKVWLKAWNFQISKNRWGGNDDTLFSKPTYLGIGKFFIIKDDPYNERKGLKLRERPKTGRASEKVFKPSFNGSKIVTSEFEHFKDHDDKVFTRWEGPWNVKLDPKNFVTGPVKKGGGW